MVAPAVTRTKHMTRVVVMAWRYPYDMNELQRAVLFSPDRWRSVATTGRSCTGTPAHGAVLRRSSPPRSNLRTCACFLQPFSLAVSFAVCHKPEQQAQPAHPTSAAAPGSPRPGCRSAAKPRRRRHPYPQHPTFTLSIRSLPAVSQKTSCRGVFRKQGPRGASSGRSMGSGYFAQNTSV